MIFELKGAMAYICPICSEVQVKDIDVFEFSGEKIKIFHCENGHKNELCLKIIPKKDKYKIEMICPICYEKHMFQINASAFWKKDIVTFKCPVSGIDAFFVGNEKSIKEALDKQSEIFGDFEIEDDDNIDEGVDCFYDMVERFQEIAEQDNIYCTCGCHDIEISVFDIVFMLSCPNCGAKKEIESSDDNLMMIINASAIVLGNEN